MLATSSLPEAVQMEHADPACKDILFVDWVLGNACNFTCSYCPPHLHNGTVRWVKAEKIIEVARALVKQAAQQHKSVTFQFAGGEVTAIPDFLATLQAVRDCGARILILSNGSRSAEWWGRAAEYLDEVVLTFHPERMSMAHFIKIVQVASSRIRTHVNVAAPPAYFDLCMATAESLAQQCSDITITLKPMLMGFGDRLYPYTPEQLSVLERRSFVASIKQERRPARGPMLVSYADQTQQIVDPSTLVVQRANQWLGWSCHAGLELLCIRPSGDVFRGQCRVGNCLGNINDLSTVQWPVDPVICTKSRCSCLLDIMTSRRQVHPTTPLPASHPLQSQK